MKATKNTIRVFYVVFLLSLAAIPARAQEWSSNLLVNPGAETGDLTGWTENNHFFSTIGTYYGSTPYFPHSGQYVFTTVLGDQASYGSLSQYVDVSNYSSCIDSGNSYMNSGAWSMAEQLGPTSDACKLTVQFFSDNGQLLDQDTTGEISNAEWKEYNLSGSIPSGTKTLKAILEGFLHYGSWPDCYFDDTYLYVSECVEMSGIRIIDTIPTHDVEFVLSSVTKEPYSVSTEGDKTIVEWRYDRFEIGRSETIAFDLNLYNLVPNEDRLVDHKLEVIYNDKNGKEVRYELPSLYVHVLNSAFDSTISTDKTAYTANEEVKIDASITNLSGYERTVDARVRIEDNTGAVIKEVANVSLGFGVPAPTVDPVASPTTYKTITLSGTKAADTSIVINEVEVAALDSSTTWQGSLYLAGR